MLILLILCGSIAFIASAVLIRYGNTRPSHYGIQMPQRFHLGHVPRLGGAGMFIACSVGWAWMEISETLGVPNQISFKPSVALFWWGAALIAVLGGVYEDLTQRLSARYRLLVTLLAASVAVVGLDLWIGRLGWPAMDAVWMLSHWPAMLLALLAIAGLPHAFNLIDGYNGLAGTVALIVCFALGYVSLQVDDRQLCGVLMALAGATAGFLVWNYPRGLLFAGDGGAYLWGVVLAIASIQLVQRHAEVSPWFPVLLLIYPVWETFFSIYRKTARGQSPGVADALHFHQLIYRRIVRGVFHDDASRRMLMRNNRTSPFLWGFTILTVIPAVLFWHNTSVLMAFCGLFVLSYVWAYVSIVRFKVPRWLRR
ncbi:MAG: glycosyltransferase family 4 protein [Burkholderiales bacterium]